MDVDVGHAALQGQQQQMQQQPQEFETVLWLVWDSIMQQLQVRSWLTVLQAMPP